MCWLQQCAGTVLFFRGPLGLWMDRQKDGETDNDVIFITNWSIVVLKEQAKEPEE